MTVDDLMTPVELLRLVEHAPARKILPDIAMCFDDLLKLREEIRNLRLLPVKTDEQRAAYKLVDKQKELDELELVKFARFLPNKYPYLLPPDVNQELIWVRDFAHEEVVRVFIRNVLHLRRVPLSEVILFERPLQTETLLVKGTFNLMRHIHCWTRKPVYKDSKIE